MQERTREVSPLWVIPAAIALGVAAGFGWLVALSEAGLRGFLLGIMNPPPGAHVWSAQFFDEPTISSPVLYLDEWWSHPGDPQGRTDLMVRIFDSSLQEIFVDSNLGPLEQGKTYIYDWSTRQLRGLTAQEES